MQKEFFENDSLKESVLPTGDVDKNIKVKNTLSKVDKIEFTNGASIMIADDGLILVDKNHKFKKII